jgi:hypothetical protein
LADSEFYERMFVRFYHILLLPFGLVGAMLGAFLWKAPGRVPMIVWLISLTAFFFIAGEVHRVHEYYQLPFVVVAATFFGGAAWPLFDGVWLSQRLGPDRWRVTKYASIVALLAIASIYCSSLTQVYFAPRDMAQRMRQAGRIVDVITDDNSVAIVVDDYGIMSPIFLYFAHLKGWSFEPTDVSPSVADNLRRLGARYFVTTRWDELKNARPDTAAFLELYQDVPVDGAPPGTRLIDFRQRRGGS